MRVKHKPGRFRRLRQLARINPRIKARIKRVALRRWSRKARRAPVRFVTKAPRYPKAVWLGQTSNTGGPLNKPRFIVCHYTAAGSGADSARYLFRPHDPSSSAHFLVDRNGDVYQLGGIDLNTWHAGRSSWKGKDGKLYDGLNQYAIGIEHANFGFMRKGKNPGEWLTAASNYKSIYRESRQVGTVPFVKHKYAIAHGGETFGWEPYPDAQIAASLALTHWLLEQLPSIQEIVGHDDISPGRKSDPGPAFPMVRFQACLEEMRRPKPSNDAAATITLPHPKLGLFGDQSPQVSAEVSVTNIFDNEDLSDGEAALASKDSLVGPETAQPISALPGPPIHWYESRTMVASIVTVLASILGVFGIAWTDIQIKAWVDLIIEGAPLIITLVSGLIAAWARRRANAPIKGGPADPIVIADERAFETQRQALKGL